MENLAEYIKHTRHFDGLGMGDQDLEQRAQMLQDRIEELEADKARLIERTGKLTGQVDKLLQENIKRGARMQVMREFLEDVDMWIDFTNLYEKNDPKDWFDADGVPVKEGG